MWKKILSLEKREDSTRSLYSILLRLKGPSLYLVTILGAKKSSLKTFLNKFTASLQVDVCEAEISY